VSQTDAVKLAIHVYCGNFVGPPFWHGLDYYEPAECNWEGVIEVDPEEYEGDWRRMASFKCEGCGAVNLVTDHDITSERTS
jgi:hypothetical protein